METENSGAPAQLTEEVLSNMKLFCDVARENGSSISLKDLIALTSINFSEEQLANSWDSYRTLSSQYGLASGIVLEKVDTDEFGEARTVEYSHRFERANSNIAHANQFAALLNRAGSAFKVLSVSGSTSYLSVSETDDLDFFCIGKSGAMWASFVRALILARAFRFAKKNSPAICLSYVSDENFVRREFSNNKNGLFARDALSTKVIGGEAYFVNLLRENSWMALYFPRLYGLRIKHGSGPGHPPNNRTQAMVFERILNLFLYYTAGTYIRIKSYLLNRKFSRDGKFSSLFKLRMDYDHCIYESADYVRLRRLYDGLEKSNYTTA